MQIWMDGDACPKPVKDILFRTATRTKIPLIVVSNHALSTPASPYIKRYQVGAGFDVADNHIVDHMQAGDLVITADIPLANDVVDKGGWALNPRGELYSINN
ncbi:MAG TPA: YaiI/YqxD family protein, partial [Legionella sp.]|nr:YaiI/YqxD family protein [Legionella sp.]